MAEEKRALKGHSRLRLLYVVNNSSYFVSHRLDLACSAQSADWDVAVLARDDDPISTSRIVDKGIMFFNFDLDPRSLNPIRELGTLIQLQKILRQFDPSLVHSLTIKAVIYSGLLCRFYRIANVCLIPGLGTAFNTKGIRGALLRFVATGLYRFSLKGKMTRICLQTKHDYEYLVSRRVIESKKSRIIRGSGVVAEAFPFKPYKKDKERRCFVLISRMLRDKGIIEFVEASKLVSKSEECDFLLVGSPDHNNPNTLREDEIRTLCSDTKVSYIGFEREIRNILRECDIFVLPTYYGEGIPKAILEAQACGLPVIASNIAGCREVIDDGLTGVLVPPRNPAKLADAMLRLCQDPNLADFISANAYRVFLKSFQFSVIGQQYLDLYDEFRA